MFVLTRCSNVREAGDTTQIQLRDMEGLFLFCGVISALALAVAAFRRLCRLWTSKTPVSADPSPA